MILSRKKNPLWVGLGLFLISTKPQFLPLGFYYLYRCRDYRVFFFPAIGLSLSFLFYGFWIPEWLAIFPPEPHQNVNVSFYPWALPVWLLLPFAADIERFTLAATVLPTPYFNQASLIVLFVLSWQRWAIIPLIVISWLAPIWLAPISLIYAMLKREEAPRYFPSHLPEF